MPLCIRALTIVFICFTLTLIQTLAKLPHNSLGAISTHPSSTTISNSKFADHCEKSLSNFIFRGGVTMGSGSKEDDSKKRWSIRQNLLKNILGLWGVSQVISILANAIKRLVPIAIQPLQRNDMIPFHWFLYISWCLFMGYTEGYKAFQLKFSPLVVSRAFSIANNPTLLNTFLAGPYSMGLFGADRKRMIVSWSITAGVFALVKLVKFLPYPYRSIVDAGVVVGLSYGTLSIFALTIGTLLGWKSTDIESKS